VLGKVPTISIDKTDGCQMYLSQESLDVEIISSKSSEMNVLVPKGNGDFVSISLNLYASVEMLVGRMYCE
jgi:adenylyl cyclase-associated protein